MPGVLRQYDPDDFEIVGGVLRTKSGGLSTGGDLSGALSAAQVIGLRGRPVSAATPSSGQALVYNGSQWEPGTAGLANGVSRSWPCSGALLDYTGQAAYTSTEFTEVQGALTVSDRLGDDSDVPLFYVWGKASASAVSRTGSGFIAITKGAFSVGAGLPYTVAGCALAIPLPALHDFDLEFTLQGNGRAQAQLGGGDGATYRCYATLCEYDPANQVYRAVCHAGHVNAGNVAPTEQIGLWQNSGSDYSGGSGVLGSFEGGGLTQRRYRFRVKGMGAAVYASSTTTGNPTTFLRGRMNPVRGLVTHPNWLLLVSQDSSNANAGHYTAIGNIVLTSAVRNTF